MLQHDPDGPNRITRSQELFQFRPDTLRREGFQAFAILTASTQRILRDRGVMAIPSDEPEQAQDTQIILAHPFIRLADKAKPTRLYVRQTFARRIENLPIRIGVERVDGKVATLRILRPVLGVGDDGPTPVCLNIPTLGCDFIGFSDHDCRERAMGNPRRDGFDSRFLQMLRDRFGLQLRRKIDIRRRDRPERVPDAPPDKPGRSGRQGSENSFRALII